MLVSRLHQSLNIQLYQFAHEIYIYLENKKIIPHPGLEPGSSG